jgi:uncharacterized protein (DUF779 family)
MFHARPRRTSSSRSTRPTLRRTRGGELVVGPNDLLVGEVAGVSFHIDAELYERWNRPSFVLDLSAGSTDSFSLEGRDAVHFLTRSAGTPARCAIRPVR